MYAHVGDPSSCRVSGDWSRSVLESIASITLGIAVLAVLIQIKHRKYRDCQVETNTFYMKRTHSVYVALDTASILTARCVHTYVCMHVFIMYIYTHTGVFLQV